MRTAEEKIEFLKRFNADGFSHQRSTLLSHLSATEAMLRDWQVREALSDAGLFHSVYGTESFRAVVIPPSMRDAVAAIIGEEAERVVFLFGVMVKASLYACLRRDENFLLSHRLTGEDLPVTRRDIGDLCHLSVANWLEQRPRAPVEHRFMKRDIFADMRRFLCPPARAALDDAYGFSG